MRQALRPLGIDIGASRLRVLSATTSAGRTRVQSVAVRDLPSDASSSGVVADPACIAAILREAVRELGTKERRCVCAIGESDASVRALEFPRMSSAERAQAARFEAARALNYPISEATVRVRPLDARTWILGVAKTSVVQSRVAVLRGAGLRLVAMDHESYALYRALPEYDGILDMGLRKCSLHVKARGAAVTFRIDAGGAVVTQAIASALRIDASTAERRKRILGIAGTGDRGYAHLFDQIARAIRAARTSKFALSSLALLGNAARLPGLARELSNATGIRCETPVSHALRDGAYPDDVARAGAPDWTLAAGLALWERA